MQVGFATATLKRKRKWKGKKSIVASEHIFMVMYTFATYQGKAFNRRERSKLLQIGYINVAMSYLSRH